MNVEPRIARAIVGAVRERDRSGHEIWRWLGPVHGATSELTERSLYPTLYRLEAQGILESHWREGESIRRAYRLARGGLEAALANGWAPIAYRASSGAPEDSSWNFGFRATPSLSQTGTGAALATSDAGTRPATVSGTEAASGTEAPLGAETAIERQTVSTDASGRPAADLEASNAAADAGPDALSDARPDAASDALSDAVAHIDGYCSELASHLRLDDLHAADVRTEIEDHLTDAVAALRSIGVESDDASTIAIEALGPAADLAAAIDEAQFTRSRLRAGMSWGSAVGTLSFVVVFAITLVGVVLAMPLVTLLVRDLAATTGFDLYLPGSADLEQTEALLPASLAAFLAARRSITHASARSRRSERVLRPLWIAAGGVPLAVIVLLVPVSRDPVVLLGAVAVPAMWALGCLRPVQLTGELLSRRGVALATALVAIGLVLPGAHSWLYHRGELPPAAPAAAPATVRPAWLPVTGTGDAWTVDLGNIDLQRWHDVRIEIWPLSRDSLTIGPDRSANGALYTVPMNEVFALGAVPGTVEDWLVLVTAADEDGVRRTLSAEIRQGTWHPARAPLLRWLLSP